MNYTYDSLLFIPSNGEFKMPFIEISELTELTIKRENHLKSCEDNNDRSHHIIADLYSDPSHFIYEILQNADDAQATEVEFRLHHDSLFVRHNGKKLFDLKDVASITTVGSSTNEGDPNTIGSFGAGFKSIFAVTKTPHIHSGQFHFKISDFIVPQQISGEDTVDKTIIEIPFNREDVEQETIYTKITEKLLSLESESLLFLRNIREIQWMIQRGDECDSGHYMAEITGDKACLISQVNEHVTSKDYILYSRDVMISNTVINLCIAYPFSSGDEKQIIPVNNSKLFVFFPTNESTGLKFIIHAPYKTTPSRDSIPFDDPENQLITNAISDLARESVRKIKQDGLLNVNFLKILPFDQKHNHPIYQAIHTKIVAAFKEEALLPTATNGFVSASNAVLAREKDLTSLLNMQDCQQLFGRKEWLNTGITFDRTRDLRDYFTDLLGIPEINMKKFCGKISEPFIKHKSDQWIIDFYSSITKVTELYRKSSGILRRRPIIRLADGVHIEPENNQEEIQVYLPGTSTSQFNTVKKTIADNEDALIFLKDLGLKEPDSIAEITEFILPKYTGDSIATETYIEDVKRVIDIWKGSDVYQQQKIIDKVKMTSFVRCCSNTGDFFFQQPEEVYFQTNELATWFEGNPADDIFFIDIGVEKTENSK